PCPTGCCSAGRPSARAYWSIPRPPSASRACAPSSTTSPSCAERRRRASSVQPAHSSPSRLALAGPQTCCKVRAVVGRTIMLTLYYAPGACSLAAHIVLEESGEKYEARRVDFSKAEQRSEAYLKINPQGRVPALLLDSGEPLAENTAILPYLGNRFGLWPKDPLAEARALSLIGFFAASVHPAHAHISRPERYASDKSYFPDIQAQGRKTFQLHLEQIDQRLAGREWLSDT